VALIPTFSPQGDGNALDPLNEAVSILER